MNLTNSSSVTEDIVHLKLAEVAHYTSHNGRLVNE